jgi:hypothetical protein
MVFQFRLAFFFGHGDLPLSGKYTVADYLGHSNPEK